MEGRNKDGNRKPRLLLVEDLDKLRRIYVKSLEKAGFEVTAIEDGKLLEEQLVQLNKQNNYFDVILSDTELGDVEGDISCREALNKKLIDLEKTLLIGMSYDHNNITYWRGIANHTGFYEKKRFKPIGDKDLGEAIMNHYCSFSEINGSPIWKARMPIMEDN